MGEKGKLLFEGGKLTFFRNVQSMLDFIEDSQAPFDKVAYEQLDVTYEQHRESGHKLVIGNFANAILRGETLIAPAMEGIHSVMLANAMVLSHWLNAPVDLPLDGVLYAQKLQEMIASSAVEKNAVAKMASEDDMGKSL